MTPDKISVGQYGFMPKKCTEDDIVEFRRMVSVAEESIAIGLLFDIAGAFDNVWWPFVLDSLRKKGCPRNVFRVLRSYSDNRTVKISLGNIEVSRRGTRGRLQGSVLGPTCWNLMFDGLLRELEELVPDNFVAYADDLLVLTRGNTRVEIGLRAQRVVDRIIEWCSGAKLELSARKTEGIIVKRRLNRNRPAQCRPDRARRAPEHATNLDARPPVIRIGNTSIAFKDKVKYLSVYFDKGLRVKSHCEYLRGKIVKLFSRLGNVTKANWGLRYKALLGIYNGVFVPVATYATLGWADLCTIRDMRVLGSAQRTALLAVNCAYRTASYDSMCAIAGVLPIKHLLAEYQARYRIKNIGNAEINDVVIERRGAYRRQIREQAINM